MKKLYWNTVAPILKEVLQDCIDEPIFKPFRLVGGTALSLQLGHRMSVDIDLFTDESKALELWLLNRGVAYSTGERSHFIKALQARVPVLEFDLREYRVRVSVFAGADARHALKAGAMGQAERGTAAQVGALVRTEENESPLQGFLAAIR